jgi:hypothetical protein
MLSDYTKKTDEKIYKFLDIEEEKNCTELHKCINILAYVFCSRRLCSRFGLEKSKRRSQQEIQNRCATRNIYKVQCQIKIHTWHKMDSFAVHGPL